MSDGEQKPITVWVEEEEDFGAGDGTTSKKGTAWNVDEGGNKGDIEVGDSERTDESNPAGSAVVTLILHLNGREFPAGTIVAKGALPFENGDVGSGLLAITGGTGGHSRIRGVMRVDSWNPKKYSVEGGG
jgi:hypothetical protein